VVKNVECINQENHANKENDANRENHANREKWWKEVENEFQVLLVLIMMMCVMQDVEHGDG